MAKEQREKRKIKTPLVTPLQSFLIYRRNLRKATYQDALSDQLTWRTSHRSNKSTKLKQMGGKVFFFSAFKYVLNQISLQKDCPSTSGIKLSQRNNRTTLSFQTPSSFPEPLVRWASLSLAHSHQPSTCWLMALSPQGRTLPLSVFPSLCFLQPLKI